jgi:hypothetical protein
MKRETFEAASGPVLGLILAAIALAIMFVV